MSIFNVLHIYKSPVKCEYNNTKMKEIDQELSKLEGIEHFYMVARISAKLGNNAVGGA